MESSKISKRQTQELGILVRRQQVPLNIVAPNPNRNIQVIGLVSFPTQKYKTNLGIIESIVEPHNQTITYRTRTQTSNYTSTNTNTKKFLSYNKITLKSKELKKKQFTFSIPLKNKPRNNKNTKEYLILQFNNDGGILTLAGEYQEANMDIIQKKRMKTSEELLDLQRQKLDMRRKDPQANYEIEGQRIDEDQEDQEKDSSD